MEGKERAKGCDCRGCRGGAVQTVIGAGLACVNEVLEAERIRLCGARYQHQSERQALRGGHVAS